MKDEQKNLMIKAFVKLLKGQELEPSPLSHDLRELFGK